MATITANDRNIQEARAFEPIGLATIKGLVQQFAVCWEAHPEQAVVTVLDLKEKARRARTELRKIGFSLELYGTPEPAAENVLPGCHDCLRVQSALKEIADWILPREERRCMYEVEANTQALSYSRVRAFRPDVRAAIQILHRSNWDQPIDEYQGCCLKDMERALHEIGACEGAWSAADMRG